VRLVPLAWAHLWESTICAAVLGLVALALRRGSARTRYGLWLIASIKFLTPFVLLTTAGRTLGTLVPAIGGEAAAPIRWLDRAWPAWTTAAAADPVAQSGGALIGVALAVWTAGTIALVAWRARQWRAVAALTRAAAPLESGREVAAVAALGGGLDVLQGSLAMEPGVVGIVRQRLLWPAGLSDRLDDPELASIVAHEVCHARRRDNLAAVAQMAVESLFWFNPVVWWVGAQLVAERERACDEEVMQMGTDKRQYAESILKVGRFCLNAPAAFVAGVGGANLARRIEEIMSAPAAGAQRRFARAVLAGVVAVMAAAPVAAGMAGAAGAQDKVYKMGEGVKSPKLVYDVKPRYTKEAMDAKIQGIVRMSAVILETGDVGDIEVTQTLDKEHGLDDEAVKALKLWKFEPGTRDGKAVPVRVDVEMSFTLK
jgi:TonB family protein